MQARTSSKLIPQQTIDRAAAMLLEAAPAGSEVILFGSYARGDANTESDLDFMVVEPVVKGQHAEMIRLRQILRELRVPVDVLVVSRAGFEAWKGQVNTVVSRAAREGRSYARTT